jgi:Tol biopolymer transport system component/DNA-binding winged helix-turn-helix (wHTH) protein
MASRADDQVVYRFGNFRLDPAERLLVRHEQPLPLTPKSFDLLLYLVERHGRLVEKQALLAALWPNTVVEEANLAYNVSVLRKVLDESKSGPSIIQTVPTKGYRFTAPVVTTVRTRDPSLRQRPWGSRRNRNAGIAAVVLLISSAVIWSLLSRRGLEPPRVLPVTTLHGSEREPTLSPDGSQVAFVWDGGVVGRSNIYVQFIGSPDIRQLTSAPALDVSPSWSPDGTQIAFVRLESRRGPGNIHLISVLGGHETKLSDVPIKGQISWSPDSRVIAAGRAEQGRANESTALYVIPVENGEPRALTSTTWPAADRSPAFSRDGALVAYTSCESWDEGTCNVYLLHVDSAYRRVGSPHRLTSDAAYIAGLSWSRDGRSIVYGRQTMAARFYLFQLPATGANRPERIELAGAGAVEPWIARSRDRLMFSRSSSDVDIYRAAAGGATTPVIESSFADYQPQFSPDGRRIAFVTTRSGEFSEISIAAADGTGARPLTRGSERSQESPHWSPDGRQIAFDAQDDRRHLHVWVVDAEGGRPRQLTNSDGNQNCPTWSRDGRAIYYTEVRGPRKGLWRVPAGGGAPVRITAAAGGYLALESPDGKSVLYQATLGESPVMMMPLSAGRPRQVVTCAQPTGFAVHAEGVYYVECGSADDPAVHLVDLTTGRDRALGKLQAASAPLWMGLAVSPDGTAILYSKLVNVGADLMMIENFR